MPLSMCKVGSRVIVKDLFFEMDYLNRFYSLGIYPGADLEVMATQNAGRLMIRIKGMNLVLGEEITGNIRVDLVEYKRTA
ncbi:MAG: FeoA domain [Eubacteriaceae bacterium]|nr:FeoA domain [Eubacteriaceae bacterium]MDK2937192.1 FeoA domain [Eubacteriaceae bacterium]MDK2962483.1 FeoA domain [Eubacteriaceae bacterium]